MDASRLAESSISKELGYNHSEEQCEGGGGGLVEKMRKSGE